MVYVLKNAAKTESLHSSYHKRRPEYKLLFKKEHQFFPRHAASLFAFGGQSAVRIFIAFAADLHIVSAAGSTFLHLHRVSSCNSAHGPETTTLWVLTYYIQLFTDWLSVIGFILSYAFVCCTSDWFIEVLVNKQGDLIRVLRLGIMNRERKRANEDYWGAKDSCYQVVQPHDDFTKRKFVRRDIEQIEPTGNWAWSLI